MVWKYFKCVVRLEKCLHFKYKIQFTIRCSLLSMCGEVSETRLLECGALHVKTNNIQQSKTLIVGNNVHSCVPAEIKDQTK